MTRAKQHVVVNGRWVRRSLFRRGRVWHCCLRDTRNGRVHEISTGQTKRSKAEQGVLDWIREREAREQEEVATALRFDGAYQEFLDLKDVRAITLQYLTLRFQGIYKPVFGPRGVHEIGRRDIEVFLKEAREARDLKPRTVCEYLTQLRSFFRWARQRGYCLKDPTEGLRGPKSPKRRHGTALTRPEAARLLRAARDPVTLQTSDDRRPDGWDQTWAPPSHLYLAILIALHTGLRKGNVRTLTWNDVDLENRRIFLLAERMKGNEDFSVPIHPELAEALKACQPVTDQNELVIGRDLKQIYTSFRSALTRAKLPRMRWHDLRHTAATWWSLRCTHAVVQRLLGHAPADVTGLYQHVPFEHLRDEVDKSPWILGEAPAPVPAAALGAASGI